MSKKKIIVVLGMHRSGTSLVTRGLAEMGVKLGSDLMAPDASNKKGHWEDMAVYSLNEEILQRLGVRWDTVKILDEKAYQAGFDDLKDKAANLLRDRFSATDIYGVKDPRLCRLLPFWKPIFSRLDIDPYYIVMVRNPLSVAASLERRNGLTQEVAFLLWTEHVIDAVLSSGEEKRIIVDYDRLMSGCESQLMKIADFISVSYEKNSFSHYCDEFLDESLRHNQSDINEVNMIGDDFSYVRDLYLSALSLADGAICGEWMPLEKLSFSVLGRLREDAEELARYDYWINRAQSSVEESERLIMENAHLASLNRELKEQYQELQMQYHEVCHWREQLYDSLYWRATWPARYVIESIKKIKSRAKTLSDNSQ